MCGYAARIPLTTPMMLMSTIRCQWSAVRVLDRTTDADPGVVEDDVDAPVVGHHSVDQNVERGAVARRRGPLTRPFPGSDDPRCDVVGGLLVDVGQITVSPRPAIWIPVCAPIPDPPPVMNAIAMGPTYDES